MHHSTSKHHPSSFSKRKPSKGSFPFFGFVFRQKLKKIAIFIVTSIIVVLMSNVLLNTYQWDFYEPKDKVRRQYELKKEIKKLKEQLEKLNK